MQPTDHTAIEDHCAHGREPPDQFPELCHNGSLSVVRPPSSEEPVAALRAVLWVGTGPYFPFALLSFAPYGGIGIKTTLGMGGVSVEPLAPPQRSL